MGSETSAHRWEEVRRRHAGCGNLRLSHGSTPHGRSWSEPGGSCHLPLGSPLNTLPVRLCCPDDGIHRPSRRQPAAWPRRSAAAESSARPAASRRQLEPVQPGANRRPKPTPPRGQLLRTSSGRVGRRWQPSPGSLRHAACGPRQGATAGRRPRCRGCWWWPSLARVLLRKWASADPSPPLPDRATLATVRGKAGDSFGTASASRSAGFIA
jgi:hypothetical protein